MHLCPSEDSRNPQRAGSQGLNPQHARTWRTKPLRVFAFLRPQQGDTRRGTRRIGVSNSRALVGALGQRPQEQAKKGLRANAWRDVGRTYFRQLALLRIAGLKLFKVGRG